VWKWRADEAVDSILTDAVERLAEGRNSVLVGDARQSGERLEALLVSARGPEATGRRAAERAILSHRGREVCGLWLQGEWATLDELQAGWLSKPQRDWIVKEKLHGDLVFAVTEAQSLDCRRRGFDGLQLALAAWRQEPVRIGPRQTVR
jgi:hypothetical protein